jgi:hypothetical protein
MCLLVFSTIISQSIIYFRLRRLAWATVSTNKHKTPKRGLSRTTGQVAIAVALACRSLKDLRYFELAVQV